MNHRKLSTTQLQLIQELRRFGPYGTWIHVLKRRMRTNFVFSILWSLYSTGFVTRLHLRGSTPANPQDVKNDRWKLTERPALPWKG